MADTQQPSRAESLGEINGINTAPSFVRGSAETPSTQIAEDQRHSNQAILAPKAHSSQANLAIGGNVQAEDLDKDLPQTHRFDPKFTENVINATGPKASPRLRKVMGSLTQHLHDFARENEVTVEEWMAAVEMVCITQPLFKATLTPSIARSTSQAVYPLRSVTKACSWAVS